MFSEYAPIVPYTSMGNIALGSDINEVLAELEKDGVEYTEIYMPPGVSKTSRKFEIGKFVSIHSNTINNKIFLLCTGPEYKGGVMDKVFVGMGFEDIMKADDSFMEIVPDDDHVSLDYGYIVRYEDNDWDNVCEIEITQIEFCCIYNLFEDRKVKCDLKDFIQKYDLMESGNW
ncbi:MAG: hypothetical protein K2N72_05435 [Oscillospiraceae bacterium]|nr:hypothetical protein [Oscillospiraceae bacterium]